MTLDDRFAADFAEFTEHFATHDTGRAHLAAYERRRTAGRENFAHVRERAEAGEDTTWLVLTRLLPHADTPYNRERGAWIHIAPAVTRDLKRWFERAGWVRHEEWPSIAAAILEFFRRVDADPDSIRVACREFGARNSSKGIQTGFLSPMLNALYPDRFCIVNSKSRKTARFFSSQRFPVRIERYSTTNERLLDVIQSVAPQLLPLAGNGVLPSDVFDAFCHWFISIKKGLPRRSRRRRVRIAGDASVAEWLDATVAAPRDTVERLFADAIVLADERSSSGWTVTRNAARIRLNVGRLATLAVDRQNLEFGVPKAHLDALIRQLPENSAEIWPSFRSEPNAALCSVPHEIVVTHEAAIREALGNYIPIAAATAARSPFGRSHSHEVVVYLSQRLGRDLPNPDLTVRSRRPPPEPPAPAVPFTQPRTLFKKVDYELSNLLSFIDMGDIALPDLQRPFVWSTAKVRDLFDSMYRGFPVGHLLFWSSSNGRRTKTIGTTPKQHVPFLLVVDGQQRLTSLYAVFRGVPVVDEDYRERTLEIAFRPRDGRFAVADAAIRRDPEFIPNIAALWKSRATGWAITNQFLERLVAVRPLSPEDKNAMSHNIDRLLDLEKYPFTALEINPDVDEQSVADVFVRTNSEGVKLNQSDFILTLLSVVWHDGRKQLERFARDAAKPETAVHGPSPFNHLIRVSPDQLLRVAIAVGFHRARLRAVYQLLRAKDLDGTDQSVERREHEIAKLRDAQALVLDLDDWHAFLHAIAAAGFRSAEMISSEMALIYSYALYLIGRHQCGVPRHRLQRLIARWFMANLLTRRYTGSTETTMEEDLTAVRDLKSPEAFEEFLNSRLGSLLTNDFWETTLPLELETSSPRSPAAVTYLAAQVRLGAPVLFSDKQLSQMLDPSIMPKKASVERHHLFPKRYLARQGITTRRNVNQVANYAVVEWPDNISIGAKSPAEHVPGLEARFPDAAWDRMCRAHALPPAWHELEYDEFLRQRRALMAALIRRAYESLDYGDEQHGDPPASPDELNVWDSVRTAEKRLRAVIRQRYEDRWGDEADSRMAKLLGPDAMQKVDSVRAKRRRQFLATADTDDLLDYTYLGQLICLMVSNEAWDLFKDAFRDKRELQDLAAAITLVRNEAAHFRRVPETDLLRCRVAAHDLVNLLDRLSVPAGGD